MGGRPKALLPFGGESLVERALSRLAPFFEDRIVVTSPHVALPTLPSDVEIVTDRTPLEGPLAALVDGLVAARGETCFVTACDQPFLHPGLACALVARVMGPVRAAVPEWHGHLQPLAAAYARGVAGPLSRTIAAGGSRLSEAVAKLSPEVVPPAEIVPIDPGGWSFFDIDSPNAYALALRRELGEPMVGRVIS